MKSNIISVLRWLTFIPAAIIVGILAYWAAYYFFGFTSWIAGMRFDAPINIFLACGICGWAQIQAGIYVSPAANKYHPALILATLVILLTLLSIVTGLIQHQWMEVARAVCVAVGTIIGTIQTKE